VLDIRKQQDLLKKNTKVRRLLRLHHLLGNEQQLEKWQSFISPSSAFSFGTLQTSGQSKAERSVFASPPLFFYS